MRIKETARMVAAAFVLAALAGCTSQEPGTDQECRGDECPPGGGPGTGPGPGDGLPLANSTVPTVQLVGCSLVTIVLDAPRDLVRQLVPDAFELAGGLAPGTTAIMIELRACDRTLDNESVFGLSHLLSVYAFVSPVNRSWTNEGMSNYFLLDSISSSRNLADSLTNQSWESQTGTFTLTSTPPLNGNWVDHWDVQSGDAQLLVDVPVVTLEPQDLTFTAHVWSGAGPFARATLEESMHVVAFISAGTVAAVGNGPTASVLGAPASPFVFGQVYDTSSSTIRFEPAWRAVE